MSEAAQDLTGKFVWYEYMGHDLDAAVDCYSHVVGGTFVDNDMAGFSYKIANTGDYGVAGLMTIPEHARAMGVPPNWTGFVWVNDLEAGIEKLQSAGGKLMNGPMDIPNVGRAAVVADPYGAVFMLFSATGQMPRNAPAPETPGLVGWRELHAGDGDGAWDFYSGQFGWKKDGEMDMGAMGVYHLFSSAPGEGGGMMTKMPQAPGTFWAYYFNVEAIDAAVERLTAKGGKLAHGPEEVPGGRWVAQAIDPQGAFFALLAPKR